MRIEGLLHFRGPRVEAIEQVTMPPLEILEHICELLSSGLGIKAQYTVDDMIGAGFVGAIEIPRLGGRPEWTDNDARRVWTQIQRLAIEEHRL